MNLPTEEFNFFTKIELFFVIMPLFPQISLLILSIPAAVAFIVRVVDRYPLLVKWIGFRITGSTFPCERNNLRKTSVNIFRLIVYLSSEAVK